MINIKEEKDGISIKISVIPNSSKSYIVGVFDGILKLKLNSPPIEGKANKEVIVFLSQLLNVPKSTISILHGDKNKLKTLSIKGDKKLLQDKIKNITI